MSGDASPDADPQRKEGGGPTKITVNLLRAAHGALEAATALTGDTRTDTINRALQLYAFFQERKHAGDTLVLLGEDGQQREIHLF
jgi:hypothetical protein